jgi:colanic acid biosynthesis glycosyl transferase WcaI
MAPIKVLVITPQYAPDFGPSVPIYTSLCEDLARLGLEVNVVTGFPHYGGSEVYYQPNKGWFAEEQRSGVRVIRSYVYRVPKSSLWRRLLYHASFNLFSAMASLRVKKPDIVLADAPTLWSGLPLIVKSILPGVPFIYIVHDIYPDVLVRLGVVNNPRIIKFVGDVEHIFYKRAAQISVLSDGFKENLLKKGVPDDKITVIPACVDSDFIQPYSNGNKLSQQWGLDGKFVVLYAGNMGFSQGLDKVVEAAIRLQDRDEIAFVFVGEGATKPDLEAMVDQNHLTNVKFFPFQPREDVPFVYALADVCLISLKKDIVVESVPSKTYTIMASGHPILATVDPDTETGRLIKVSQCGLCVEPENPEMLERALRQLYQEDNLREEMGKKGRNYVLDHFSRQVATQLYRSLIERYAGKRRK